MNALVELSRTSVSAVGGKGPTIWTQSPVDTLVVVLYKKEALYPMTDKDRQLLMDTQMGRETISFSPILF